MEAEIDMRDCVRNTFEHFVLRNHTDIGLQLLRWIGIVPSIDEALSSFEGGRVVITTWKLTKDGDSEGFGRTFILQVYPTSLGKSETGFMAMARAQNRESMAVRLSVKARLVTVISRLSFKNRTARWADERPCGKESKEVRRSRAIDWGKRVWGAVYVSAREHRDRDR